MKLKQNEAFPGPKVGPQAPGDENYTPFQRPSQQSWSSLGQSKVIGGRGGGSSLPSRQLEKQGNRLRVVQLGPGSHS